MCLYRRYSNYDKSYRNGTGFYMETEKSSNPVLQVSSSPRAAIVHTHKPPMRSWLTFNVAP